MDEKIAAQLAVMEGVLLALVSNQPALVQTSIQELLREQAEGAVSDAFAAACQRLLDRMRTPR